MKAHIAMFLMMPCMLAGAIAALVVISFGAGFYTMQKWLCKTAEKEAGSRP